MSCPSIFGGCVVYLVPLSITAGASIALLIVLIRGLRLLSREHREHDAYTRHQEGL